MIVGIVGCGAIANTIVNEISEDGIEIKYFYDRDIERAENTGNIRSIGSGCWFVSDKDYKVYDTYGSVEKLKKDIEEKIRIRNMEELDALIVQSGKSYEEIKALLIGSTTGKKK
mgnify:CR=1 FL=1